MMMLVASWWKRHQAPTVAVGAGWRGEWKCLIAEKKWNFESFFSWALRVLLLLFKLMSGCIGKCTEELEFNFRWFLATATVKCKDWFGENCGLKSGCWTRRVASFKLGDGDYENSWRIVVGGVLLRCVIIRCLLWWARCEFIRRKSLRSCVWTKLRENYFYELHWVHLYRR